MDFPQIVGGSDNAHIELSFFATKKWKLLFIVSLLNIVFFLILFICNKNGVNFWITISKNKHNLNIINYLSK